MNSSYEESNIYEHIASTKKRIGAFFIDDVVVSLLFLAIFWTPLSMLKSVESINIFLSQNFPYIILIKVLYHTFFVWQNGMTLGKYFMKIKVISLDTSRIPRFQVALLRALLRILSDLFFYLGFIMAFFNPLVQTFHDKLSKCVVIDA